MLGTTNLTSGEDFDKLPDTYVIFILEYDLKNQGLPAYQVKRTFLEDNSDFDDGTRFIFVNGTYRGSDPIGELMNDFNAEGAEQMKNELLKERVEFFKETEEGIREMTSIEQTIAKRYIAKGKAEGKAEGSLEKAIEIAKNLLRFGDPLEKIVLITGLTLQQVQNIQHSLQSPM